MGTVAARGILNGKAVPLHSVSAFGRDSLGAPFIWKSFERLGLRFIAEKLCEREPLTPPQIEKLLCFPRLGPLLTLLELCTGDSTPLGPRPISRVPSTKQGSDLERFLDTSEGVAREYGLFELRFDEADEFRDRDTRLDTVRALKDQYAWLSPVTPEVGSLAASLLSSTRGSFRRHAPDLRSILRELRHAGFERCPSAASLDEAMVMHESGFPVIFRTILRSNRSNRSVAFELCELERFSGEHQAVHTWLPSYSAEGGGAGPVQDLRLLHVLAVAALVLRNVPYKRLSSRYASLDAVRLAAAFGANDFGLGAADQETEQRFGFSRIEELDKAVGSAPVLSERRLVPTQVS